MAPLTTLFGLNSALSAVQQADLARSLVELSDFATPEDWDDLRRDLPVALSPSPAAPVNPLQGSLKVGDTFQERYRVLADVKRGGMGAYAQVKDLKLGRTVGVKSLLKKGDAKSYAEHERRFKNERRIGSQLDHDHLVTVYDGFEFPDGSPAMVLKHIDGPTLTEILPALDFRRGSDLFLDVCWGVSHMHAQGIVHRDLKPDNVFLQAATQRALVGDFGIAKPVGEIGQESRGALAAVNAEASDLTEAGILLGTVGYFDPRSKKVDAKTDLFALGVILYQILSGGRQPFREYDSDGRQVAEKILPIAKRIAEWLTAIEQRRNPSWRIIPLQDIPTQKAGPSARDHMAIIHDCLLGRITSVADLMARLLTVNVRAVKKEIDGIETTLAKAMRIELPVFILRSGTVIDPALNPADMSDDELSDLLSCPVHRQDGKIYVTAGTRDFLPPRERQALDDLNLKLNKRIQLWRTEINAVANRILAKSWPLKRLIADSAFAFLSHQEYELSREEIEAWVPLVTDYETPRNGPMTQALKGALPVVVDDMRDYTTGEYVQTSTDARAFRIEERGETGRFAEGEELDIASLSLRLGDIVVLRLENGAYAPVSIPIQASLKKRKELIDRGQELTVAPELIPKELVREGFTVIHGGTSVVGVRYGREDGRYSIPQMEFSYAPFAVKTATLGDYIRKFLVPLIRSGKADEAQARVPRSGGKPFLDIDREAKSVDVHERDPGQNAITLSQNVRGVTPEDLFSFAKYLGVEVVDSFRWEVVATNGIRGFISPTGTTVRPIYLPSFNGLENWYRDAETGIERPRNPSDIQVPEMDAIPAGAEDCDNVTLVHGIVGLLGPGLHATSTPGTIDNIVTKGVSLTATTDAVNFNARKEQMRPKSKPFQITDYAALLVQKFRK